MYTNANKNSRSEIINGKIRKAIKELKKSPVYHMSLHSKELFHSNFWAFLISEKPEIIEFFFEGVFKDNYKDISIKREYKHIDLMVETKDKKEYIIENKLKFIPNAKQLKRYGSDDKVEQGVLIWVYEPTFDLPDKWVSKTYSDFAAFLEKQKFENDYLNQVKEDYTNTLNNICNIIKWSDEASPLTLFINPKLINELQEIKFYDLLEERKTNDFANSFNKSDEIKNFRNKLKQYKSWQLLIYHKYSNEYNLHHCLSVQLLNKFNGKHLNIEINPEYLNIKICLDEKEIKLYDSIDGFVAVSNPLNKKFNNHSQDELKQNDGTNKFAKPQLNWIKKTEKLNFEKRKKESIKQTLLDWLNNFFEKHINRRNG